MSDSGYRVAAIDDLEAAGPAWRPIRHPFGIGAFGVNAWVGANEGDRVISEHSEQRTRHEELYAVVAGRATFTLDGAEIDAPTGTFVFVKDPAVSRGAVAAEPGTTVLAVGATPGKAFQPEPWEEWASIAPLYSAGEYDRAAEAARAALERHPDDPTILYNLACCESLGGQADDATAHLRRSLELDDSLRSLAESDSDFDAIRDRADFPAQKR